MLERLGLANPGKRIAHHALNQIERPDRNSALFTDPNRRSSINSGWNTASRATLPCRSTLLLLFKSDFLAQSCDGLPSRFPGLCSIHRRQQTFGIFWRPQQMESFEQPRQLIGRDERNVVAAFAADDHDATILCYFVTEFGEVSACSSVSGLNSHEVCII